MLGTCVGGNLSVGESGAVAEAVAPAVIDAEREAVAPAVIDPGREVVASKLWSSDGKGAEMK
jgi:hypothetical protein